MAMRSRGGKALMRPWILMAALAGFCGVGLGAYSAHGLAGDPAAQALGAQASLYLLLHAPVLLGADRLIQEGRRFAGAAALLLTLGLVLFAGSLALKAVGGPLPVPLVTPAGGLSLMAGWLMLALAAFF
jgi:uncharacterized membrane protein YgdD (TMEM256/DUF423 family)